MKFCGSPGLISMRFFPDAFAVLAVQPVQSPGTPTTEMFSVPAVETGSPRRPNSSTLPCVSTYIRDLPPKTNSTPFPLTPSTPIGSAAAPVAGSDPHAGGRPTPKPIPEAVAAGSDRETVLLSEKEAIVVEDRSVVPSLKILAPSVVKILRPTSASLKVALADVNFVVPKVLPSVN